VVGRDHYEVANGVRALLGEYESLNERIRGEQIYQLAPEDKQVLVRARRIGRCLTPCLIYRLLFRCRQAQSQPIARPDGHRDERRTRRACGCGAVCA
jgi:F0F1-type ATP synthase beta subunit